MELYFFKSFYIAGFSYYNGSFVFDDLKIGTKIKISWDKNNKYDDNAVGLFYKNKKIGYIPKEDNHEIATLLKAGYDNIFETIVQQLSPDQHPEAQVKIAVFIKNKKKSEKK